MLPMLRLPLQNPNHAWGSPPGPDETDPYAFLQEALKVSLQNAVRELPPVPAAQRPFTRLAKPVQDCRIMLVSDAGLAEDGSFGGRSWLPVSQEAGQLCTTAESYDRSAVNQDNSVALPLQVLTELWQAGRVAKPADLHISLAAVPLFQAGGKAAGEADLQQSCIAEILTLVRQQQTDMLIAVATLPTGLARLAQLLVSAEKSGTPSLLVNPWWPANRFLAVSRPAALFMPPGRPLGDTGWKEARKDILLALLEAFPLWAEAGAILHLPHLWPWPAGGQSFMRVS